RGGTRRPARDRLSAALPRAAGHALRLDCVRPARPDSRLRRARRSTRGRARAEARDLAPGERLVARRRGAELDRRALPQVGLPAPPGAPRRPERGGVVGAEVVKLAVGGLRTPLGVAVAPPVLEPVVALAASHASSIGRSDGR